MATITLTETEQTDLDSNSVANTSENNTTRPKTRMNKNKNAIPRKSKSAQNIESLDAGKQSQTNEEKHDIKTQESVTELDGGGGDSAFGSEDLLDDLDNLDLQPAGATSNTSRIQKHSNIPSCTSNTLSGQRQPAFEVSKLPVPQTRAIHTEQTTQNKGKFQHQPVENIPDRNALGEQPLADNNLEKSDVKMDREQSSTQELPPSLGLGASSQPTPSRAGMSDFVILHTDADIEEACNFMAHLKNEFDHLTVDLLSNINVGKTAMQSLETLHENYLYILTYVTDNLASDKYCQFLQEILVTFGLKEANGKEDRVVPVFTKSGPCGILAISTITGLDYFNFHSDIQSLKNSYLQKVKNLVQQRRA